MNPLVPIAWLGLALALGGLPAFGILAVVFVIAAVVDSR
jgi:hypothetical protein